MLVVCLLLSTFLNYVFNLNLDDRKVIIGSVVLFFIWFLIYTIQFVKNKKGI